MYSVELAALYALMPNKSGYCGTKGFEKVFMNYMNGEANCDDLKAELEKFPVHCSYLKLIADANGKDPFDSDVVEAFWLGNRLLETVSEKDLKRFISKDLVRCGLNKKKAKLLSKHIPHGILPHHSFNALYINFVTGKVKPSITNLDKCRIGWGCVKRIGVTKLGVCYPKLIRKDKRFAFEDKTIDVLYKIGKFKTIVKPRIGDWVSIHWGLAVQKLTHRQLESLKKYTLINLGALNKSGMNKSSG